MRRSSTIPTLLILGLASVHMGCAIDTPAQTHTTDADQWEEKASPKESELEQVRWRCQSFLTEHNPEITTQGFTFNQLTPNVYLVGAEVTDNNKNKYVKYLSCEKLKNVAEDDEGDMITLDEKLYVIDYADPFKMAQIANRHGFANEVSDITAQNQRLAHNGFHDSWVDNYIIWSTLYNRPGPVYYGYGSGFAARPVGFRAHAPSAPISSGFVKGAAFGWVASKFSGGSGRSQAFTSGISKNPPSVRSLSSSSGARVFGSGGGKSATVSSVSRGGFGGSAHGVGG